jgi:hypothetical protein
MCLHNRAVIASTAASNSRSAIAMVVVEHGNLTMCVHTRKEEAMALGISWQLVSLATEPRATAPFVTSQMAFLDARDSRKQACVVRIQCRAETTNTVGSIRREEASQATYDQQLMQSQKYHVIVLYCIISPIISDDNNKRCFISVFLLFLKINHKNCSPANFAITSLLQLFLDLNTIGGTYTIVATTKKMTIVIIVERCTYRNVVVVALVGSSSVVDHDALLFKKNKQTTNK